VRFNGHLDVIADQILEKLGSVALPSESAVVAVPITH
jgi:hypothetical protein